MPTLVERPGRLLLHLREADHALTAGDLELRAGEPVSADLQAYREAGVLRVQEGAFYTNPEMREQMDTWLAEELPRLGREGLVYFAYGSNMDPDQMYRGASARVPTARFLCRAELPNYLLAFPRRNRSGDWVAGLVPSESGQGAWGVLYLIDQAGIAALDRHEGHPRSYTRTTEEVLVRLARTEQSITVLALVYMHVDDHSGGGPPAEAYLERILRGAEAFSLPLWYQEMLAGIETTKGSEPEPPRMSPPLEPQTNSRSKYVPLVTYLNEQQKKEIRLTFAEMERILGFDLPHAAKTHPAWWYPSETHTAARLWAQDGWKATPDLRGQTALFRRQ